MVFIRDARSTRGRLAFLFINNHQWTAHRYFYQRTKNGCFEIVFDYNWNSFHEILIIYGHSDWGISLHELQMPFAIETIIIYRKGLRFVFFFSLSLKHEIIFQMICLNGFFKLCLLESKRPIWPKWLNWLRWPEIYS